MARPPPEELRFLVVLVAPRVVLRVALEEAADLFAVAVFRVAAFRVVLRERTVDFRTVDFRAVDLRAADLRAVDLRAVDLRAVVLPAVLLREVLTREALLRAAVFLVPAVFRAAVFLAAGLVRVVRVVLVAARRADVLAAGRLRTVAERLAAALATVAFPVPLARVRCLSALAFDREGTLSRALLVLRIALAILSLGCCRSGLCQVPFRVHPPLPSFLVPPRTTLADQTITIVIKMILDVSQ